MSFTQGPPPSALLNDDTSKGIEFKIYQNPDNNLKNEIDIVGVAKSFPVMYRASTRDMTNEQLQSKYLVGVYHKKSKEMHLLPTHGLFAMKQDLENKKQVVTHKYKDLEYNQQRYLLINAFASNKKKRVLSSNLNNKINDKTSFGINLIEANENMLDDTELEDRPDLPPFDTLTVELDCIYPFNSLASPDDLDFIISSHLPCIASIEDQESAKKLEHNLQSKPSMIPLLKVFLGQVQNSKTDTTSPISHEKLLKTGALLQYLIYLLSLFQLQQDNFKKVNILLLEKLMPSTICNSILTKFAHPIEKKIFIISSSERNKLINYIVVISLTLNYFTLDFSLLCRDLKLTSSDMKNIFEFAGCTVSKSVPQYQALTTDGLTYVAKLSAPLKLKKFVKRSKKRNKPF